MWQVLLTEAAAQGKMFFFKIYSKAFNLSHFVLIVKQNRLFTRRLQLEVNLTICAKWIHILLTYLLTWILRILKFTSKSAKKLEEALRELAASFVFFTS